MVTVKFLSPIRRHRKWEEQTSRGISLYIWWIGSDNWLKVLIWKESGISLKVWLYINDESEEETNGLVDYILWYTKRGNIESTLLDYGDSTSAHNWIIVTLRCQSTYYIPYAVGHLLMNEPCAKEAIQKTRGLRAKLAFKASKSYTT